MWEERQLSTITLPDLQGLIADRVREGRSLDYKDEPPAHAQANNDKKSEFAADVSALANGVGGLLVYGVAEERDGGQPTGIPQSINGLANFVLDAEETRLRTYLDTGLDPRLPTGHLEFHAVSGGTNGPVLLVRVRKSFSAPHMVRAEGRFRNAFYVRDGARNRLLDAKGVKEAMLASGDWSRRFHAVRRDRVAAVVANETPVLLQPGDGRIILHVVPLSALDGEQSVDPRTAERVADAQRVCALRGDIEHRGFRFNLDGLVVTTVETARGYFGYLQVFRTGMLETVDSSIIEANTDKVSTRTIERRLIEKLPTYFEYLRGLEIPPPFLVAVTLSGVSGRQHEEQEDIVRATERIPKFDRDLILVPEIFVDEEQLARPTPETLEAAFHAMWQAGGHSSCPRYRPGGYDPSFVLH